MVGNYYSAFAVQPWLLRPIDTVISNTIVGTIKNYHNVLLVILNLFLIVIKCLKNKFLLKKSKIKLNLQNFCEIIEFKYILTIKNKLKTFNVLSS